MLKSAIRWFALILLVNLLIGCGNSDDINVPSLQDIPQYPGTEKTESMEQSLGGFMGAKIEQYSTSDDFDEVVDFYMDAMSAHETEVISHASELGRQTAISVTRETSVLTVAIQEFTEEGRVNITIMAAGAGR